MGRPMWRMRPGGIFWAHVGEFWLLVREAEGMARFLVLRAAPKGETWPIAFLECGARDGIRAAMEGAEAMLAQIERPLPPSRVRLWEGNPALLVEADVAVRNFWTDLLGEAGVRMIAVSSATEALELPAGIRDPAILVASAEEPDTDGLCVAAAIRKRWPLIRAVLVGENAGAATDRLAPGDIFLVGPFRNAELLRAVYQEEREALTCLLRLFLSA